jgi:F420-non-reducing hydrogenase iron-sulfur subunit
MNNQPWEPRIVAFFCNWCTYTAADLAGVSRMKYAANVRTIRLMCSGRVDPQFIMDAFLQRMLGDLGIEPDRLRLEWISAAEGDKVKSVINDMVEKVKALGPLDLPGQFQSWDREMMTAAEALTHAGHQEAK